MSDLDRRVKKIIVEQLAVEQHRVFDSDEAQLVDDLGADSLDMVELCMRLEEEFGREIDDEKLERWRTVGDVVRSVEEAIQ
jgi:acyl carrier protein